MQKSQIDEISDLLLSYSAGAYHVKGRISDKYDEIDMIISGINMLGEELRSTNVSKEYFSSIFNAVTDLVFVVDEKGSIKDVNQAVSNILNYSHDDLLNSNIVSFFKEDQAGTFNIIKKALLKFGGNFVIESVLQKEGGEVVYGLFSCSKLVDRLGEFSGYLISVKDISAQKENEKLILKTIISTQGAEQRRVADDLHDSLGQELSMAQLMLSNFGRFEVEDKEFYNLLELCNEILDNSISHLREICFGLMPNVLVKGGLELALEELVGKLQASDKIEVDFVCAENFPRLFSELEIVIYRIVQEFINNMIKHSNADGLNIYLIEQEDQIELTLSENGQGFDMTKLDNIRENRGLSNIRTKVTAYNGSYDINSMPGKGTELWVKFPKK